MSFLNISFRSKAAAHAVDADDSAPDIYGAAMEIAGSAYRGFKDKGNEVRSSLWDHIQQVEGRIVRRFAGRVPAKELFIYRAATVLHELPELKQQAPDGRRARVYTPQAWKAALREHHMPEDFIDTVDALAVREGEAYLEYIRRLANDPVALIVKLHGDLPENMSRTRGKLPHKETTRQFQDKKAFLYPMAALYLEARAHGEIGDISVAEYIMGSRYVPRALKNREVLQAYSGPDTVIPDSRLAMPGMSTARNAALMLRAMLPKQDLRFVP